MFVISIIPITAPADLDNGANFLNHPSRPNVRKHGVTTQAEVVVRGEHTLYMIVEARHSRCRR